MPYRGKESIQCGIEHGKGKVSNMDLDEVFMGVRRLNCHNSHIAFTFTEKLKQCLNSIPENRKKVFADENGVELTRGKKGWIHEILA